MNSKRKVMELCKQVVCIMLIVSMVLTSNLSLTTASADDTAVTQVNYDSIEVINNANTNDFINLTNLNYVLSEDKSTNCYLTLYSDVEKTNQLKSIRISYSYFAGKNYSWNIGKTLGEESGTVYLTFRYSNKSESEIITLRYEAEKTSPAFDLSNVTIENKYNGSSEKIYVTATGLSKGDYIYIYKKTETDTFKLLGSLLAGSTGTVTGNYTRTAGLDKIYLTQKRVNEYESIEKQEIIVPEAGITTYGTEYSDYPDVEIIAQDKTGSDTVEVSGVGTGTVVTLYSDADKSTKIKSQTINTSGSISVRNIVTYAVLYVTLRAPDKYESSVIQVVPKPAATTSLKYDKMEVANNAAANDYIYITNLKYVDEADKNVNVTCTVYSDKNKTSKLYSSTISYSYLQGDKTCALNIGKKLGEDSGILYISFKYTTKKESELIELTYEAEQYSRDISKDDVFIINKYTGSAEKIYVTVGDLQTGDIVYVYKLLANGSYSQIGSATCPSSSNSVTINFTNPSDTDVIYLQLKCVNQYICKQKTEMAIPDAEVTTYGKEGSDLPDLFIRAVDQTGNDYIEVSGAIANTQCTVYSDSAMSAKIASAVVNTSGKISIKNIMDYSALYITVRVQDKYACEPIKVVTAAATKSIIAYDDLYINNYISGVGDSLCFSNLRYVAQEDANANATIKIYLDEEKENVLYSGTISSAKLKGSDYSVNLSDSFGLDAGKVYLSVKFPTKRESDLIPVSYVGERTSSKLEKNAIDIKNVLLESDVTMSKCTISVLNLAVNDEVRYYLSENSDEVAGKNNQIITIPVTTEKIYVTVQNYGCYESDKVAVEIPKAASFTPKTARAKVENNAGIFLDHFSYTDSQLPDGTVLSLYDKIKTTDTYVKIADAIIANGNANKEFVDDAVFDEAAGEIYLSLTYPGYKESNKVRVTYEEEPLSMKIGIVHCDNNQFNKISIKNVRQNDILRVYDSLDKKKLLVQETSEGSEIDIIIPNVKEGETVYITNQSKNRNESRALAYVLGGVFSTDEISMDKNFTQKTMDLKLDFTECDEILVGFIRTSGGSRIAIDVMDENGNLIANKDLWKKHDESVIDVNYKRWIIIKKPDGSQNVYTYSLIVSQPIYVSDTICRMAVGDAVDARKLLGGKENAIELDRYRDGIFSRYAPCKEYRVHGEYVPGSGPDDGYYYHFTYLNDTITIFSGSAVFDFRIYEDDADGKEIYDTKKDRDSHRIQWTDGIKNVVKAKERLTEQLKYGKQYYLELYVTKTAGEIMEDFHTYSLFVGDPVLLFGHTKIYATSALTIPSSGYSDIKTFTISGDSLPDTAAVYSAFPADNSGKRPTELVKISNYRYRKLDGDNTNWHQSSSFYTMCKFTMEAGGYLNTTVKGTWQIYASSEKEITIIPGLEIAYYYELGD